MHTFFLIELKGSNSITGSHQKFSRQTLFLVDFGLSNSVRVSHSKDGSAHEQEYCVTQCGSPAYAAPELLGNKKYGAKVDVWSM